MRESVGIDFIQMSIQSTAIEGEKVPLFTVLFRPIVYMAPKRLAFEGQSKIFNVSW